MSNLKSKHVRESTMTRALSRARKVGGSLIVVIPKNVVEQEDIREGELVELEVRKAKKSFFGVSPGIGPFTAEDRLGDHD
ncbi:MAG: AbrB/MazE/SpoVT family DNA-binding domain-containing protein [Nitrososphaerota archaeon]|nr:AbrB/MazE/SpoVT family DNA-binding domain-containing protein [Nitrososphaerota archaeon]